MTRKVPFGKRMRKDQFLFAPSYTPLNHGSFGAYPRAIQEKVTEFQTLARERPDVFIVYDLPRLIDESRVAIAPLLGVDVEEVVFVPNATTGINTVLRNLKFSEGDVIVYFSTIYDSCFKTISSIGELIPVTGVEIPVVYPIEDDEILTRFMETIVRLRSEGKNVKLAIFDTVLTFPGARVPWEKLVWACKRFGVLSLIDGAHGVGHIDLKHLGSVGPDFFVSNCYKWLYTPQGCAVFHVPKRNQHLIRTSIPTSHGYQPPSLPPAPVYGKSPFVHLFEFVATVDYIPYLLVPTALKFRLEICGGEDAIRSYIHNIARLGGTIVAERLGTEVMTNYTSTLTQCAFANVRLPLAFKNNHVKGDGQKGFEVDDAERIRRWLNVKGVREHDTYLQIAFHGGHLWVRLSGQIYLEKADFEWIGGVLEGLCGRLINGETFEEG